MLRFSANLGFLWPDRPLLDRIDAAARAGFGAVELHWPYDVPASAVRDRCAANSLELLGVNTSRGNTSKGEFGLGAIPGRQADFQSSFDEALAYCIEARAGTIHCMAGKVESKDTQAGMQTLVENLKLASRKALASGITLLLEPINQRDVPGYFYSTIAQGAEAVSRADCGNIGLMFDCYHVGLTEGDMLKKLREYLPQIKHIQIAAVPDRTEPDGGELDYRAVFATLLSLGYDGYVGCEYRPKDDTDKGLGWVSQLGITSLRG